jgi:hypothetical protein
MGPLGRPLTIPVEPPYLRCQGDGGGSCGFGDGSTDGFAAGFAVGFADGFTNGFTDWFTGGFAKGFADWFTASGGFANGFVGESVGEISIGLPGLDADELDDSEPSLVISIGFPGGLAGGRRFMVVNVLWNSR